MAARTEVLISASSLTQSRELRWKQRARKAMANQRAGKAASEIPALKPYRGKPAVRNFRGGNGNVGIIRSPVRAIALPDSADIGRVLVAFSLCVPRLTPDHDQHHLKPLCSVECMGLVGGHQNHLSLLKMKGLTGNRHVRRTIEDGSERVERRGMFAQTLSSVESE